MHTHSDPGTVAIRDAFFRYAAQRDRANRPDAQRPLYDRGNRWTEPTGDGEFRDMSPRTVAARWADAVRSAACGPYTYPIERPAVVAPDHRYRTPVDAAYALVAAGLVDVRSISGVTPIYRATPRRSVPTHAVLDVTPGDTGPAATMAADRTEQAPRVTLSERLDRVVRGVGAPDPVRTVETIDVPMLGTVGPVPVAVVRYGPVPDTARMVTLSPELSAASAADPGAWHTSSARLSGAAARFLADRGEHWQTPDTWSVRDRRYHSRADRVAFKGLPRFALPSPVRYERAVTDRTAREGNRDMLTTRAAWHTYCQCGHARAALPVARAARFLRATGHTAAAARAVRKVRAHRSRCHCAPVGWVGHTRTVFALTVRANRAATATARAATGATGTRGTARTPWTLSARSLPRAAERVAPVVTALESILRTAAIGATLTLGTVTVTVLDGATVTYGDRTYPVREWARRAALAGVTPD